MNGAHKQTALVTLTRKPDPETADKIAAFAESKGCDGVRYTIDEKIIGGIIIQIGDVLFDGSIRTRLEELKRSI